MAEIVNFKFRTPASGWVAHPDLRPMMREDAAEKGTTMSDLANQILASRLGVPHTPVLRKSSPSEEQKDQLNFTMPTDLAVAVAASAAKTGQKKIDYVTYILCSHYGLRVPAKKKFTRRRRVAPA